MTKKELLDAIGELPDDTPIFVRTLDDKSWDDYELEPVKVFIRTHEYPDIPGAEPFREIVISTTYR